MREEELIEKYREIFKAEISILMELVGQNYEEAEFIAENALDLALTDKRNETYK